jgi:hypothetical protein
MYQMPTESMYHVGPSKLCVELLKAIPEIKVDLFSKIGTWPTNNPLR